MEAKIQAVILGFDYAYIIKNQVEEILGRSMSIEAMIDSKTVFNVVAKEGKITEKRLQIDILALRQSYDGGELKHIAWIPGDINPEDPLTKPNFNTKTTLYTIMVEKKGR